MARVYNLARMTTATTGTGTITLGSAVSNHVTFGTAGVEDGETISYAIEDGTDSEVGVGVYTASGTTLTRSLLRSTTGSLLNLSGNAQVFITPSAEDFGPGVNAQTGTTYTIVSADLGRLITFSNASAVAVTLPQATGRFKARWFAYLQNLGAGTVTITPTTSTINGAATLVLRTGQSATVVSDGTNWTALTSFGMTSAGNLPSVTSLNGGPLAGFRNRLINGCMRINQRGSTSVADDTYCFDRWYVLAQTAAITVGAQTNIENGWPYAIRLTQSQASAQRMGLAQIIESANSIDLRGETVTFSGRVQISASSQTLRYAVVEWTGTADTVTSDWVNDWTSGTFTAGNFFTSTTTTVAATGSLALTANTPTTFSVSATITSSANNVAVMFWTDGTQAQNVTLDAGRLQLEIGSTATDFESRAVEVERLLAQSYYFKLGGDAANDIAFGGYNTAGGGTYFSFPSPSVMRVSPAASVVGTWSVVNCGQPSFVAAGKSSASIVSVVTATGAFLFGTADSSTYLTFAAEL